MKNILIIISALLYCNQATAQSQPLTKEQQKVRDSIDKAKDAPQGFDDFYKSVKAAENQKEKLTLDTDKDGVIDKEDACPLEKGTKENKGCPAVPLNKLPASTVKKDAILSKIEQTLLEIFQDANNDFVKHIGASFTPKTFYSQAFNYGLTLGGNEKLLKYFDQNYELENIGFSAKFETTEELKNAASIKKYIDDLEIELLTKHNCKVRLIGTSICIFNTNEVGIFDYTIIHNKLTEITIYSSGAEQVARSKNRQTKTNNKTEEKIENKPVINNNGRVKIESINTGSTDIDNIDETKELLQQGLLALNLVQENDVMEQVGEEKFKVITKGCGDAKRINCVNSFLLKNNKITSNMLSMYVVATYRDINETEFYIVEVPLKENKITDCPFYEDFYFMVKKKYVTLNKK